MSAALYAPSGAVEKSWNGIAWREYGTGPTCVVFLHAMAGSCTAWDPQLAALGRFARCVAWDMPGFGQSQALPSGAKVAELSDLLAAFTSRGLAVDRAHFVGLSVGGMILQDFGVQHPDLVSTLTLMDTSPRFGLDGSDPEAFRASMIADIERAESMHAYAEQLVAQLVGPKCDGVARQAAVAATARARPQGLALATHLIAAHDATDRLARIQSPTLVMVGAEDGATPPSYAKALAAGIPGARYAEIANAGHLPNLENPKATSEALLRFLDLSTVEA